ncbi:MAG: hypothetical protein MH252_18425 [Thermosynechococcaceae cyanobacterium MS004]|nr:hypothetical protein [Thermosynechococcaceae cyanobacterium MS004]
MVRAQGDHPSLTQEKARHGAGGVVISGKATVERSPSLPLLSSKGGSVRMHQGKTASET